VNADVREALGGGMSKYVTSAALVVAIFAFGVSGVFAMGGGGDLSPVASPYAILAPITVAPPVMIDGRVGYIDERFSPAPNETPLPPRRFNRRSKM